MIAAAITERKIAAPTLLKTRSPNDRLPGTKKYHKSLAKMVKNDYVKPMLGMGQVAGP
jgi:hypothetical protein